MAQPIVPTPTALELPIFPLNAVLFPGGMLPLRIFEARYMDMVRDCMRDARPFGVCLIRKGKEVGGSAQPEPIGCRATITDWNMEQLGVLQISTRGTERFRIAHTHVEPNGLLRASVESLEREEASPVAPQYVACAELLQRIIQQLNREIDKIDPEGKLPIAQPYRLDDSTWVGNRLCEILPISLAAKQKLMELTDAPTRLSIVHQYLLQQKIL
ncbi:MAG: LON peptidase substrate-binding domain-containing protein [Burkholderiaceae bacterium]